MVSVCSEQTADCCRGCRQGNPISPYIFILCVEILGILIRNCNDIKGIKFSYIELKVIQYVDDTPLILDGTDNLLRVALSLLNQFSKYSGPNIEKTRCIWLGSKRHSKDTLCEDLSLLWLDEQFIFLGIIFMPPLKKGGGAYCFAHVGRYVGMSVGRYVGRYVGIP